MPLYVCVCMFVCVVYVSVCMCMLRSALLRFHDIIISNELNTKLLVSIGIGSCHT